MKALASQFTSNCTSGRPHTVTPIFYHNFFRPSQKKQVESDIAKASVLLGLQQTGKQANCNQLLASLFTLAMDKKEQLAEFLDKRTRQCGVCGAVAEGPDPWCSNCATFHDSVRALVKLQL